MENETTPRTTTYYAIAHIPNSKKTGIILVTKEEGKRSTQTWTGEEFRTQSAAESRMCAMNAELARENAAWKAAFAAHGITHVDGIGAV